jgi:hypothetical protein
MLSRKFSQCLNDCDTTDAVMTKILMFVKARSVDKGIEIVNLVEDLPDLNLTPSQKKQKALAVNWNLNHLPQNLESNWFADGYSERDKGGFREQYIACMGRFVRDQPKLVADIFNRRGRVVLSGFGVEDPSTGVASDLNRKCTYEIDCSSDSPELREKYDENSETFETNLRDDTNQIFVAMEWLRQRKNVVVYAEDADMVQISLLALSQKLLIEKVDVNSIGNLSIQMTKQHITNEENENNKEYYKEYIHLNALYISIVNHKKLDVLNEEHRVPSIVALFIILGGDTTSYLYLPYKMAIEAYLDCVSMIGSLVKLVETDNKFKMVIDKGEDLSKMKKLMIVLYAYRNPKVLKDQGGWSKFHNENIERMNKLKYEIMQREVAFICIPRFFRLTLYLNLSSLFTNFCFLCLYIFRYMPSARNLDFHVDRACLRMRTWGHAIYGRNPDVKLLGFIAHLRKTEGSHITNEPILEPTYEML